MNKRFRKLMASLVALLMTFSYITASAVAADKAPVIDRSQITVNQGISDFVTRLYDICLGRNPDPTGFKTWTEQLSNGENTGVGCAYGFIFSNEFQNKNVSNDQYIELMYNCFFGRASDPEGKANWLNAMNSGMTREELFLGFANSVEFFNLCKSYGITAGCHVLGKDYQKVAKINLFVERLYNIILSRPCDQAGMIDWSTRLANKEISGAQAAYGFIFSDEYRNKNRSDSDFLEDLYLAFMGRASDQGGKAYWQNQINIGRTDRDIFNGFTGSQEFIAICNDYGIDKGGDITSGQTSARAGRSEPTATTAPTATPRPEPRGHYEKRLVTPEWDEVIVDQPAWDETVRVAVGHRWIQNDTGEDVTDIEDGTSAQQLAWCNAHNCPYDADNYDPNQPGYCICNSRREVIFEDQVIHHEAVTHTIHHDAVYEEVWVYDD